MKEAESLKRVIGTWGLSSNIINSVIGAGIFVLPAIVAERLGPGSITAYVCCGVLISLIMLCFAEMGSRIAQSGGPYSYIEAAFGNYAGFLATNLFVLGVTVLASAAIANALADTLSDFFPLLTNKFFRSGFFLLIFSGLAILNIRGVNQGITLVKVMTILKLTPLFLLLILGVSYISAEHIIIKDMPAVGDIGKVSLILFFAFQGAENGLCVGGEIRDSTRVIPRGIFIAFLIILFIYGGIQVISLGALGDRLAEFKTAPLAEVANQIMGPVGITIMIAGAAVSMLGYLSGDVLNMPRVIYASARDNVVPLKLLASVHPRFATPYNAIIVFTSLAWLFSSVGEFSQLAVLSSASILLIYLGVVLSVIKFRLKKDESRAAFRIPGGYIVPVLAIIVILWLLSNLSGAEKIAIVSFIALLTFLHLLIVYRKKLAK